MPYGIFKSNVAVKESLRELLASHPISDELLMTSKWKNMLVDKILRTEEKRKLGSPHAMSEDDKQLLNRYALWSKQVKNGKIQYLLERPTGKAKLMDSVFLFSFEDALELIKRAHSKTDHGDPQSIENFIHKDGEKKRYKKRYSRYCIPLFFILEVCLICKNKYNIGIPELNISAKYTTNQACHATVSVDILEMLPDNVFNHLLIVQYKETNYIQLRPLTSTDDAEIFSVLYQLFMDLIVPQVVFTRPENCKLYSKIVLKLSSLCNTKITLKADESSVDLKPSVRTRMMMWLKREVGSSWGIGCNFVQWEMNNIAEIDGTIPYTKMFSVRALQNCTRNIDMQEFMGINTIMDTDGNLPSTDQTYDQLRSTNVYPVETQESNVRHIKEDNNLIENMEINNEFGATLHIPDDNSLVGDDFDFEHFIIEEEKVIQNYKDLENDTATNVSGTNIMIMEDDDSEMIIPDMRPENIDNDSFNLPEPETENISFTEENISETKYNIIQPDNEAAKTAYSSSFDHICTECKKTIRTKVYICYKCTGKIHLYCGSQCRDEKTSTIVSYCITCKNNL